MIHSQYCVDIAWVTRIKALVKHGIEFLNVKPCTATSLLYIGHTCITLRWLLLLNPHNMMLIKWNYSLEIFAALRDQYHVFIFIACWSQPYPPPSTTSQLPCAPSCLRIMCHFELAVHSWSMVPDYQNSNVAKLWISNSLTIRIVIHRSYE